MNEDTHVYVGTLPCGCHVAAVVDVFDNRAHTARAVQGMIRRGYTVHRIALRALTDGTVKLARCVHAPVAR